MANSYSDPDFNIDTDVDEAGLETLKGGALASTDKIYVFNNATCTLDKAANTDVFYTYPGDNSAASAETKVGHIVINKPGYTLKYYDNTSSYKGMVGYGSSSTYTILGAVGNYCTIEGNTTCAPYSIRTMRFDFQHVLFKNVSYIYIQNNSSNLFDVIWEPGNATGGFHYDADYGTASCLGMKDPGAWNSYFLELSGGVTPAFLNQVLDNVKLTKTTAGNNANLMFILTPGGGETKYWKCKYSDAPWTAIVDKSRHFSEGSF